MGVPPEERTTGVTSSEAARHVRAELDAIATGLCLPELVQLVALGRKLLEHDHEGPVPTQAYRAGL